MSELAALPSRPCDWIEERAPARIPPTGEAAMSVLKMIRTTIVLVFCALAAEAHAADGLFELEWKELAPGVHVGQRADPMRYPVVCNTVIVIGSDGVLIFDGGGFPAQGEQVAAKVKALTPKPVKFIVISHWHGDHNRGIWPILDAYPQAQIVGHEFTKAAMLGAPMQRVHRAEVGGGARDTAEAVKKGLADNKFLDGSPLDPAERGYFERFVADSAAHQAELARMKITPPTLVFDKELFLKLGDRTVELRHFGPANTKGDAVMLLGDVGIVAAGDIVVAPIPYGFGSYPASWAAALKQIKAARYRVLVPGHGPLQTDTVYIDLLAEALKSVAAQVNALAVQGKSLDEVRKAVDFSKVEARFTRNDSVLKRFFGVFFRQPIVAAAYNVAKGVENEKLTDDIGRP
jgi:glyoxylase-like metal-dependent hydrolase (beta-lactamase superfamily II)